MDFLINEVTQLYASLLGLASEAPKKCDNDNKK